MAGVLKTHLHPTLISSKELNLSYELVKFISEVGKTVLNIVSDSISYFLFRGYSQEQSMINTATTAVKLEGLNLVSEETLTRKMRLEQHEKGRRR